MATIDKTENGKWRVQIRRRGLSTSKTFASKGQATAWAREIERKIDLGQTISKGGPKHLRTIGDLMRAAYRRHARSGQTAAAVKGVAVSTEEVDLARVALNRLGIIGRGNERDRRPVEDEIQGLLAYFDTWKRMDIPMSSIVRFAIATALRQGEIARIEWPDIDACRRMVKVRDRKDPRKKDSNHQDVPLTDLTGFDAWEILQEQRQATNVSGRIFPYYALSARICAAHARYSILTTCISTTCDTR